jgi:hypothetical protein
MVTQGGLLTLHVRQTPEQGSRVTGVSLPTPHGRGVLSLVKDITPIQPFC